MNLTGQSFGDLTVEKAIGEYKGERIWHCRCLCGNRRNALENDLIDGKITHCGCKGRWHRRLDLTGQRFGRLVAEKYMFDDHRKNACWLFLCDCGNERILPLNQVKWSGVQSCGCMRKERMENLNKTDLTGKQFGRLTAMNPTEERAGSGSIVWECRCDCGNTVFCSVNELTNGQVKSCGCFYRESRKYCAKNRTDLVDNTSVTALVTSKRLRADNTSGVTGIYFDKRNGKWGAYISYQRKRYYLGQYEKKEDAIKARQRAEQEFHDPLIEEHWDELPKNRQDEYLAYLKGIPIEYPPSVNI